MRQYFTQMRQEMGQRLVERVFGSDDKPSKVIMIYQYFTNITSFTAHSGGSVLPREGLWTSLYQGLENKHHYHNMTCDFYSCARNTCIDMWHMISM